MPKESPRFSRVAILLLACGAAVHAATQISNHLGYLGNWWQEVLIPTSLAMIFAPVLYVVRLNLSQSPVKQLVVLGLGSELIHLFFDFADDSPFFSVYPIFQKGDPIHVFLQEIFGAAALGFLLAALFYFIVSYQKTESELSKERDVLRNEIEERGKAEEDLRRAKSIAETANRAKSEFIARVSHEIRTPMTSIVGYAQMLHDEKVGPINEAQKECLETIQRNSQHLLEVIEEILDLSAIEADKYPLTLVDFNLESTIENCLELMRNKIDQKNLRVSFKRDSLDPIRGDEKKIRHVILNLLSNACKFTPEGGRVGVVVERILSDIRVTVWDTGIGVPPSEREKVFEDFYRIEREGSARSEGTGIGLAICKKFIELHNGRIWVESQANEGSRFIFSIPQAHVGKADSVEKSDHGIHPLLKEIRL
ncbi:MAG: HAMP domain-containing histidine kinase [Candidatus Omnitrophica bacterium]|nr:HAMP domain-containing histidine kinase [Candidatus Omnitrophota bacterium]